MSKNTDQAFESIRIVGGLISSKALQDARRYDLPGQSKEHYQIEPGLTFNDDIGRYWRIAQARWQEFQLQCQRQDISSHTIAQREWLIPLLEKVLGYRLESSERVMLGEREFPITHSAFNRAVPFVLCGAEYDLDKGEAIFGQEGRKRSPMGLQQEYLNAESTALWAIVSNGLVLRLLRDNPAMTRPAYIEVDFARMFEEDNYADFATFWLTLHTTRLEPQNNQPEQCWLEQWREKGQEEGERILEGLDKPVKEALRQLGSGFLAHEKNQALRDKISKKQLTKEDYFQQILRLVYRFLFLMTAEDRDVALLPKEFEGKDYSVERNLYQRGYALSVLREKARLKRHYDSYGDAWQQLLVTFKGFAEGQSQLAQPALGGLFSLSQCRDLVECELKNRDLLLALFNLSFFEQKGVLERINYRDMDSEEFGSVYESLLELVPQISMEGTWSLSFIGDADSEVDGKKEKNAAGNDRKRSGSYYTPDSLVQELIKSALEPVIEDRLRATPHDPRAAVLSIKVCDPACGSGHFLLAAARRLAAELARIDAGSDQPTDAHIQHAMHDVVRNCIYGVDINPLAIELCKTGLWLESIEAGKPMSFLDAHIQSGNSLLGVTSLKQISMGIPKEAYKALSGDDPQLCKKLAKSNSEYLKAFKREIESPVLSLSLESNDALAELQQLESLPEDTVSQIEKKQRAFEHYQDHLHESQLKQAVDLYMGAYLALKDGSIPSSEIPDSQNLYLAMYTKQKPEELGEAFQLAKMERAQALCDTYNVFNWPLAFPQVFSGASKGFDCILGNPPWERIKLQEEEFFSVHSSDILAARNKAERAQRIDWLSQGLLAKHLYPESTWSDDVSSAEKDLYQKFIKTKRTAEALSVFAHIKDKDLGRYPLTGVGDVNTYALFSETIQQILSPSGRAGFIVPSGLATDNSTKDFFGELISKKSLFSFYEFENEGFFKGAGKGHMLRFALTTLLGRDYKAEEALFMFQGKKITDLLDKERVFSLSAEDIERVNPNTLTCPIFQSRYDAELTKKIYQRVPVLIREARDGEPEQNPWGVRFMAMFHMSNDSHLFKTYEELINDRFELEGNRFVSENSEYVPLYEAKMIYIYNHRYADFSSLNGERAHVLPRTPSEKLGCLDNLPQPYYWVPEKELTDRLAGFDCKWFAGWRDVTDSRASARTLNISFVPRVATNHKLQLIFSELDAKKFTVLIANLSSIVCDYFARQKVGGLSFPYFIMKQIPVLHPDTISEDDLQFITTRLNMLTCNSVDMRGLAEDLNMQLIPYDPELRSRVQAELDAYFARLYGFTGEELNFILDPQVVKPGYPSETFSVLKRNEIKEFGEYRTKRLILEAWDKLEAGTLEIAPVSREVTRFVEEKTVVDTKRLPDNDWQRPGADLQADTVLQLAAILRACVTNISIQNARLALLVAMEPRILVPFLNPEQHAEWLRLNGSDAAPLADGVTRLQPNTQRHWGEAIRQLRGDGLLIENLQDRTWSPGEGLNEFPSQAWAEGRAGFVMAWLNTGVTVVDVVSELPQELRVWLNENVA